MTETKQWDVLSLLKTTTSFFSQKGIDEPKLTTELLLAAVLNLTRMDLFLSFDRPISQSELDLFRSYCKRRLQEEPVQYILGTQNFLGFDFEVNSSVLIPRPETELLVEEVIENLKTEGAQNSPIKILDIGTGSGVIPISMIKKLESVSAVAIDISKAALFVATRNAEKHKVESRISFIQLDVLDESFLSTLMGKEESQFSAVVSNPPYIPVKEKNMLADHVIKFEPHQALFSETGFEFYEKISKDATQLLKTGGKLFFELHSDGASTVRKIVEAEGFTNVKIKKDYSGFQRILIAEKRF
ncbi:MAG: peptide chain release factor N(5)-glutamine methyltransferase [Chloroherpetonaceae bacterium]|nr:peptide chain release factor N(5)-glutamine methyltransferase [Chloroherpetonaceae bacterium]